MISFAFRECEVLLKSGFDSHVSPSTGPEKRGNPTSKNGGKSNSAGRRCGQTCIAIYKEKKMSNKFQVLQVAFVVAVLVTCLEHWQVFLEWFGLATFAGASFLWALSQSQTAQTSITDQPSVGDVGEELEPEAQAFTESAEPVAVEDVEDIKPTVAMEMAAGTDDLSSEAGAMTETETTTPSTTDVLIRLQNHLEQQLQSLPQNHKRRKVWAALCKELAVPGGGKVRDAKLSRKAKFLADAGVRPDQLVKAKVQILTLAATA